MKSTVALFLLVALSGCTTLEERLGRRVGCEPSKVVVTEQINVPAYNQYKLTCNGKEKYVCRDAPFYNNCEPDTGVKKKP